MGGFHPLLSHLHRGPNRPRSAQTTPGSREAPRAQPAEYEPEGRSESRSCRPFRVFSRDGPGGGLAPQEVTVKLNTPIVGVGIGAGASALTQVALRAGAQKVAGDGTSKVRVAVARNPGAVGMVVGSLGAGGLFLAKKKDAALGAIIGATAASLPGLYLDWQARKALAAAAQAASQPAAGTTGLMVAERRALGTPTIEVFGAPPSNVEVIGQSQSANSPVNLNVFGGGAY